LSPPVFEIASPVSSKDLATALGLEHFGPARMISAIAAGHNAVAGCLSFGAPKAGVKDVIWISRLPKTDGPMPRQTTLLVSNDPRLDFIRALHWLKAAGNWPKEQVGSVHTSAQIHASAIVELGAHVGPDCQIGAHSVLHAAAHLERDVVVGNGTTIGHPGFGYARQNDGTPIHFPHLGRAVVQPGVVIGNMCSISRGTLADTLIGQNTKIDDQCYIAHNVQMGQNGLVMSGVRLNGRVAIGENCWLGTGSMVREGLSVGSNATVGMGAVVVKNVADGKTVAGNPARVLE
jgi:acetyltransferase-like isoleucine patch superfamily enzyme